MHLTQKKKKKRMNERWAEILNEKIKNKEIKKIIKIV